MVKKQGQSLIGKQLKFAATIWIFCFLRTQNEYVVSMETISEHKVSRMVVVDHCVFLGR